MTTTRGVFGGVVSAAMAGLLAGCQGAFFGAVNLGSGDVEARDAVYDAEHGLQLTLYRARAPDAPVAVFFYGGTWQGGKRERYAFVGRALARCGVTTAVADYRKSPEVTFPVFVQDAARALAWTHAHVARREDGRTVPLFLTGHSAGAHLAALVATDARYLRDVGMAPGDVAGVVGIAGPYDFLPITDPDMQRAFGPRDGWPQSQPVNFVDGDEPPFLLLHGRDDKVVWTRNSERLAALLDAAGTPVTLHVYPDLGHVRILLGLRYPSLAPTLRDTLRFIADHGGAVDTACLADGED